MFKSFYPHKKVRKKLYFYKKLYVDEILKYVKSKCDHKANIPTVKMTHVKGKSTWRLLLESKPGEQHLL